MNPLIQRGALAAALTLSSAGLLAAPVEPDNTIGTETRSVAPFNAIAVEGPWPVVVTAQGAAALELRGPRKEMANVETVVTGDTLTIRPLRRTGWHFSLGWGKRTPLTVHIAAPHLASLKAGGSAEVRLEQFHGQKLTLSAAGSGALRAGGDARELSLRTSGSGNVDLRAMTIGKLNLRMNGSGDVAGDGIDQDVNAELNGSGDLDLHRVQGGRVNAMVRGSGMLHLQGDSKELRAELSGSGDLNAGADCKQVKLTMTGPGQVTLAGKTDKLDARLSGSGELHARQLWAGQADVVVHGPGSAMVNVKAADKSRLLTIDRSGAHERAD